MEQLINHWHCDNCEEVFFTILESQPEFCPFCACTELSDSMVYKLEKIK